MEPQAQSASAQPTTTQSLPPAPLSDPARPSQDEPSPQSTAHVARLTSLNKAEKYWTWKAGLRVIVCVLDIVAIGCLGWLMSSTDAFDRVYEYGYGYYGDFSGWAAGVIVTFCLSFAWCLLALLIPFVLKPPRPLHPGIAVGLDLIFWLGFLVVGLFTVVAVYDIASFGTDGYIQDPGWNYSSGYMGEYYLAPNNTWVYNVTRYNDGGYYYNSTSGEYEYPDANTTDVVRDCTPLFATCQEQDQYVNDVWHQKPRREATSIVVNAAEWLLLMLHFTLFVWACVDTHRHNARTSTSKEQIIADRIIADLESKGFISVTDGVVQPVRSGRPEMTQEPGPSGTS